MCADDSIKSNSPKRDIQLYYEQKVRSLIKEVLKDETRVSYSVCWGDQVQKIEANFRYKVLCAAMKTHKLAVVWCIVRNYGGVLGVLYKCVVERTE